MGPQWRERQWRHNLEAAEALRRSREEGFADWEVTMRFYAAVPLVNGWFERQDMAVPTKHHARRRKTAADRSGQRQLRRRNRPQKRRPFPTSPCGISD